MITIIEFTQASHIIPNVGDTYIDRDGKKYIVKDRVLSYNNVMTIYMEGLVE